MKNQTYRMTMLYDFYGEVLTPRQKEFFDLYYNEDLSLGEIAENYSVTRQAVRDIVTRAEGTMTELEDKTHLIRRFQELQEQLGELDALADRLRVVNDREYRDGELDDIVEGLRALRAKLSEG